MSDVIVSDHGTLWEFTFFTEEAEEWIRENVAIPSYMWKAKNSFVADYRCAEAILEAIAESMEVKYGATRSSLIDVNLLP